MQPNDDKITIRPLTETDIPAVIAIFEESLGTSFIETPELEDFINNPDKQALLAVTTTGIIAGVATAIKLLSYDNLLNHIPYDMSFQVSAMIPDIEEPIGLLKSISVKPDFRGRGIAYLLGRARIRWLAINGVKDIISIAWTDKTGCHAEPILIKLGFTDQGSIENYWFNDSIENKYSCPSCGFPCHCTARIFFKGLT